MSGHKQTEIGMIPEDWEVKLLPDICRFRGGKAHERHISDLGRFVCVNSKFISTNGKTRKYSTVNFCPARRDDILMVMSDLPNGRALAKAYLTDQDDLYAVNQRVCALTPYRDCPTYLFYVLNRNPYFLKFDDGVNQTHLLNRVFQKCRLPIPPTMAEQEAIAEALSDVDAFIESLERLLSKKRHLKQGAMQELLTSKRRLPGFRGEWELRRLGELSDMGSGGTPASSNATFYDGEIRWVSISDMTQGGKTISLTSRNLSVAGLNSSAAQMFPAGTVLYAMYASLGECSIAGVPLCSSQAILGIRTKSSLAYEFLYYYLASIKEKVKNIGQQGTQANLNKRMVQDFQIPLPPLPEQTAIAAVLSDMDAEITGLEAKLTKARQLKQGMMQELLTGRIRLV